LWVVGLIVSGYAMSIMASSVSTVGPFTFTKGTGYNMTVVVQKSMGPTINGAAVGIGDLIAAYSPAGLCIGASRFADTGSTSITVWGDDDQTPAVDGAFAGDSISFRVYDSSAAFSGNAIVTWIPVGTLGMSRAYTYLTNALAGIASLSAIAVINPPVLTFPANTATGISTLPALTWGTVATAVTYRVQVSTSSIFASTIIDDATLVAGSKAVTPALINDTIYYWRVNATKASGTSSWSTFNSFRTAIPAPALIAPANAAVNVAVTPALSWGTVAGAATYRVQVSTISTFATTAADDSTLTAGAYTVTTALTNGVVYFWRTNAKNTAGTSAWSAINSFTTIIAAPIPPVLTLPANAATGVATIPTLTWGTVAGAATYRVQVSTISTFATTDVDDATLTAGSKTLTTALAALTTYYWRVSATNVGGTSAYTAAFSFTTTIASPVLTAPATASTNVTVTPTLTWGTLAGAATYRVQVSTISTFATTVVDDATPTVGSKTLTALANSTQYFWRVNATGTAGTSGYSAVWNFTTVIAAPVTPTLTAPVNGDSTGSANVTLTWSTVANAATYRVQVSTISTFATTVIDDSTLTVGTKAYTNAPRSTTYYWRVNAKNAGGTSAWSLIWSIKTKSTGIINVQSHYVTSTLGHNGVLELFQPNGALVMSVGYDASATKAQMINTASKSLAKGYYTYRFRGTDAKVEIVGKLVK
jgi:hypothetical protein